MPARSYQIPGGARVLIFECEFCRRPAHHGFGCNILAALHSGDVTRAGRWFCDEHKHIGEASPAVHHAPSVQTDEPSLFEIK